MMMICLLLAITWFPSHSLAQNTVQDFLDAHNAARAQVRVGPMRWDNALASYALNYANSQRGKCPNLVHSGGPYGENLAAGRGEFSGRQAVELWVDEKQFYVYDSNSCAAGEVCGPKQFYDTDTNSCAAGKVCGSNTHLGGRRCQNLAAKSGEFLGREAVELWVCEEQIYGSNSCAAGRVCKHYTQVVWRNSVRLGCARVQCSNGLWYVICNYDPPGNYVGQRPY